MSASAFAYQDYLRFQNLIQERSGLHFPEKRSQDLAAGVLRAMAESGHRSTDDYYRLLCDSASPAGRAAFEQLVNLLTIGETHFFRDEAQFDALEHQILPALIQRRTATWQRRLRVWSAGCASGEEAYSIAMALHELLPAGESWDVTILATDINSAALKRAQEATYGDWSFREDRARGAQSRYFVQAPPARPGGPARYRLSERIRSMVTFAPLNLVEDPYPALYNNTVAMDMVLCRNVMIYFRDEMAQRVLSRLGDCLVADGWLVLGHADPVPPTGGGPLQARVFSGAVLYQKTVPQEAAAWSGWSGTPMAPAAQGTLPVSPARERPVPVPPAAPGVPSLPWVPASMSTSPPVLRPAAPAAPAARALTPQEFLADIACVLASGQTMQAIGRLEAHVHDHPEDAAAHSLLGEGYANLARWHHAREACETAVGLDPLQRDAHFVLGMVLEHSGDLDGALESFKRVVYLDREHVLAHMALAGLHQRAGRRDAAQKSLSNVIRLLERQPATAIIPGSGGTTAGRLAVVARDLLRSLQEEPLR